MGLGLLHCSAQDAVFDRLDGLTHQGPAGAFGQAAQPSDARHASSAQQRTMATGAAGGLHHLAQGVL